MRAEAVGNIFWRALGKTCSKDELLTIRLICNWDNILPDISMIAKPAKIIIIKQILVLEVQPGQTMFIQYQHDRICDEVNLFLGKKSIRKIVVKTKLNECDENKII